MVRNTQECLTLSKITKHQLLWEGCSYSVYLFYVVSRPWKFQCCHVILDGYSPVCPKFSEITICQYLWDELSDLVDFLHVVICILLEIHQSCKNMLFWADVVRHGLSANQIVRCFKLKKILKTIWGVKLFFAPIETTKNIVHFWVITPKYSGEISFQDF